MATSILDFITQSAILANVIEQGQTLNPEETQSIMMILNNLLDSWNAERLNIYSIDENDYPLTAHKGSYTLGLVADLPTVDFNADRPALIQQAKILRAGLGYDCDMLSSMQWAAITETDNEAKLPTKMYWDNAFPVGTINLNPVPICDLPTSIDLFTWHRLAQFDPTVPSAVVRFPDGYGEALQYGLAVALPSAFGLQLDQWLAQKALDSKARLRQLNAQILAGPFDPRAAALQAPTIGVPTQGAAQ